MPILLTVIALFNSLVASKSLNGNGNIEDFFDFLYILKVFGERTFTMYKDIGHPVIQFLSMVALVTVNPCCLRLSTIRLVSVNHGKPRMQIFFTLVLGVECGVFLCEVKSCVHVLHKRENFNLRILV